MVEHASTRLQDYPFKTVRLACRTCERQERFSKDRLIATYGQDVTMINLQSLLAACDRQSRSKTVCGLFFPDLVTE